MFRDLFEKMRDGVKGFFGNRMLVAGILFLLLAVFMIGRLFQLQIVRGNSYYEDYVKTTKREVSIPAARGNIYDRNGELLAGNRVVYSVTLMDGNYYTKSDGSFNEMLLRLIHLLEKYDVSTVSSIPVYIDDTDTFMWESREASVRRFIRDVYGQEAIDKRAEKGEDAYTDSAETVMTYLMTRLYNFTKRWDNAAEVSKSDALKICNIRYALAATSYTRYISTEIAGDVSDEVQAAVLESQKDLYGVNIESSFDRIYYNSECFSGITGYVGSITTDEIEELNAEGGDYNAGDIIGKEGVEEAYESSLQGKKGKKTIYVDSTGIIMHEEVIEEPVQGNDICLSVDAKTTIAAYNIVEQQLAGIVVSHLYEGTDYDPQVAYENSEYLLPIRDVYFQMINNNILSMKAFQAPDASDTQAGIYAKFRIRKEAVKETLTGNLTGRDRTPLSEMDEYAQGYYDYLYRFLRDSGYLVSDNVDPEDATYLAYKAKEIGLPEMLEYGLVNGWFDLSMLNMEDRYNDIDTCYGYLIDILTTEMNTENGEFDKLIYDELIHDDIISGCEICIALLDQEILTGTEADYSELLNGNNVTSFEFFKNRIAAMELKPSQIALDPCSAGLVLNDPNTGEILACVSYPGYDANQINDSAYYNGLINDLSAPLYSRATQSRLAPGSTFKMITATAALEGGYLGLDEEIECAGIFDKLDHPRCWIFRTQGLTHGWQNLPVALGNSCNVFFYELGYRFSTNAEGQYSPSLGISVLNKYASMYGFGQKTGIEITENNTDLTSELPVTSAIGQGTYMFTTISLARYVACIASSGNLYEMKLLKEIKDPEGNTLLTYTPEVTSHLELQQSTWDAIHQGMYNVVHTGSRAGDLNMLRYDYAAKSGSAQENRNRPEHGWYVSYGPYDDIQYSVAVQIPYGYGSGNAALITHALYEYLEGDVPFERILQNSASDDSTGSSAD